MSVVMTLKTEKASLSSGCNFPKINEPKGPLDSFLPLASPPRKCQFHTPLPPFCTLSGLNRVRSETASHWNLVKQHNIHIFKSVFELHWLWAAQSLNCPYWNTCFQLVLLDYCSSSSWTQCLGYVCVSDRMRQSWMSGLPWLDGKHMPELPCKGLSVAPFLWELYLLITYLIRTILLTCDLLFPWVPLQGLCARLLVCSAYILHQYLGGEWLSRHRKKPGKRKGQQLQDVLILILVFSSSCWLFLFDHCGGTVHVSRKYWELCARKLLPHWKMGLPFNILNPSISISKIGIIVSCWLE